MRGKHQPGTRYPDWQRMVLRQVPLFSLAQELEAAGRKPYRIGGALEAGELDAKRAIDQAARLAARL